MLLFFLFVVLLYDSKNIAYMKNQHYIGLYTYQKDLYANIDNLYLRLCKTLRQTSNSHNFIKIMI